MAQDLETECNRYASLLLKHPLDIACVGIGEWSSGLNDPRWGTFRIPVRQDRDLDPVSQQQQVNDGWFDDLEEVREGITLTIPAFLGEVYLLHVQGRQG